MEQYVYNANQARNVLSGGDMDRYIFNAQDGNGLQDGYGLGSFFSPIFKAVVPLAKSIGASLFGLAKPVAKAAGREAIKGMATAGLTSLANKTVETVRKSKRKKSSSSSRKKPRISL